MGGLSFVTAQIPAPHLINYTAAANVTVISSVWLSQLSSRVLTVPCISQEASRINVFLVFVVVVFSLQHIAGTGARECIGEAYEATRKHV